MTCTPEWVTHKWEDNYNCRGSTQGARGPSPTLGSPAQGSCTRKTSPQNIWLWSPVGLTFRRARGLWEIETPLLKGAHRTSHAPGPRAEAVIFFLKLYWSIIALQWCVTFCFITKWISYAYTYIPISPPSCISLPPSLSHPSRWSQSTKLISLCYATASH